LKIVRNIFLVIFTLAIIGGAGYFGFSSTVQPTPTAPPAPKTVAVTTCDVDQTVTAPGTLINTSDAQVKMPVNGRLAEILVKPGDHVAAGQVLAELDDVAKTEARSSLLEAKNNFETTQKTRVSMDYPRASAAYLEKLKKDIKAAQENVALMADLYKNSDDPVLKTQALANLTAAQSKKDELIAKYNWYVGKPSQNDKDSSDAKLALAKAKYQAAQAVLASLEIKSPLDGIVLDVSAVTGQTFGADDNLFKITDPQALEVKANVTEEDFPLLAPGMLVEMFFDARSDLTVHGKVDRIVPKRIEGDRPLYNIYITIDEVPSGLADGMTADAAVTIAKHAGVLCLPRAVVRASGEGKAVIKIWTGAQTETRTVTLGLRGDTNVEIVSGLKSGDLVVTK